MFIRSPTLLLAIVCAASLPAQRAQAAEPLSMVYYERKPFHYSDESGKAIGLTADPTDRVSKEAGISITWQMRSANWILEALKKDTEAFCSPGWYKTPERESFAQFTLPIYHDKPLVGLANKSFEFTEGTTAAELFARPDVRLLLKRGFVNGTYLDQIIAKLPASQLVTSSAEVADMAKLVHLHRADLFIFTDEEIELYVKTAGQKTMDFKVIRFTDVPAVENRYIVCSKKVPAGTIKALNAAIANSVRLTP